MSSGQPDGIGYAEQEEAVRVLSEHYTAGRLDVDEFDERVRRARASTTATELGTVFSDLPEPHPSALSRGPAASSGTAGGDAPGATPSGDGGPASDGPGSDGSADRTVATPQYPGATAQVPNPTDRYPAPDRTQDRPYPEASGYPGQPYPDQYPGSAQYPTEGGYPGQRYPGTAYPGTGGTPYPDASPYPGGRYPEQYPGGPYPAAQYPGEQYPGEPDTGAQRYGAQQYGAAPYGAGQYGAAPHGGQYPPPGGPYGMGPGSYDPAAPYGWDPVSGRPFSDKQKIIAGLLQIFLPFGIGRFYTGHVGIGVTQLLVTFFTFGFGAIWPFIDGIVLLAGSPTDPEGRPLRP